MLIIVDIDITYRERDIICFESIVRISYSDSELFEFFWIICNLEFFF